MSTQDLRLLVTGTSGFIGWHLALHAHRLGLDVRATGRAESEIEKERLGELQAAGIPVEPGDLRDAPVAERVVRDRNAIVHLAAAQHEAHMPDAYFRTINVDATRTLLQAARGGEVKRFVYGSTIGVYGEAMDRPLDEDTPTRPDNIYGRTKLQAEALVRAHADAFETCIVRISETYGPGDRRLLKLFRTIDRGHFVMIGTGENRRQPIFVADLVRGLLLAAEHPAAPGQTFIFAGPQILTTKQMVADIAAALGRPPPTLRLPLTPFLAAATVLELSLRPLRIEPPLHRRRLDFFRRSFLFSTAKAQASLGFSAQTDFLTGAAATVNWYRARGDLPHGLAHELKPTKLSG